MAPHYILKFGPHAGFTRAETSISASSERLLEVAKRFTQFPTKTFTAPLPRSSSAVLRLKLAMVMGGIALVGLFSVVALLVSIGNSGSGAPAAVAPSIKGQGIATQVAWDVIAGRTPGVPYALGLLITAPTVPAASLGTPSSPAGPLTDVTSVAWEGAQQLVDFNDQAIEIHSVRLVSPTQSFLLQVTISFSADGSPVLAAAPSFAPVASPSAPGAQTLLGEDLPSAAVKDRVIAWATAYAADDRAKLTEVAGDRSVREFYRGLGGFTVNSSDVALTSAQLGSATGTSQQMIVRARVSFSRANSVVVAEFDLLIQDPTAALPKVIAWGAPGSGPGLSRVAENIAASTPVSLSGEASFPTAVTTPTAQLP